MLNIVPPNPLYRVAAEKLQPPKYGKGMSNFLSHQTSNCMLYNNVLPEIVVHCFREKNIYGFREESLMISERVYGFREESRYMVSVLPERKELGSGVYRGGSYLK